MIAVTASLKFGSSRSRNAAAAPQPPPPVADIEGSSPDPPSIMLIKERDADDRTLVALERRASITGDPILRGGCRGAAARLRADPTTADACAFVDRWFADAPDWAVIHDLRLCIDGHAVQFNHVLISDTLEVVCLDTRWLRHGLEIEPNGACRVVGSGGGRIVASPVDALARNARKLGTELQRIGPPGGRLGLGLGPRVALAGRVLVDPGIRSDASARSARGAFGIHPRDALQTMHWKPGRRQFHTSLDRVPGACLERFAVALVARHRPTVPAHLLGDEATRVNARTEALIGAG